jgi:hypothetical protein
MPLHLKPVLFLLAVMACPALAQEADPATDPAAEATPEPAPPVDVLFTIQNNAGVMLMDVFTTVPDSGVWSADLLGGGVVSSGSNATIRTSVSPDSCEVSLRMVMADATERTGGVNLCTQDFYVVE